MMMTTTLLLLMMMISLTIFDLTTMRNSVITTHLLHHKIYPSSSSSSSSKFLPSIRTPLQVRVLRCAVFPGEVLRAQVRDLLLTCITFTLEQVARDRYQFLTTGQEVDTRSPLSSPRNDNQPNCFPVLDLLSILDLVFGIARMLWEEWLVGWWWTWLASWWWWLWWW